MTINAGGLGGFPPNPPYGFATPVRICRPPYGFATPVRICHPRTDLPPPYGFATPVRICHPRTDLPPPYGFATRTDLPPSRPVGMPLNPELPHRALLTPTNESHTNLVLRLSLSMSSACRHATEKPSADAQPSRPFFTGGMRPPS